MVQMKAHAQRMARLQLIASMLEGQSWQQAMANADLSIGRSTAYRLVQLARDPERSERPFLDDRHGHPYKLREPMRRWMVEYCTQHPGVYSSQVKAELQAQFGLSVSRGHINRVRAEAGVTAPWRGRGRAKKNERSPSQYGKRGLGASCFWRQPTRRGFSLSLGPRFKASPVWDAEASCR
jgi:transposase